MRHFTLLILLLTLSHVGISQSAPSNTGGNNKWTTFISNVDKKLDSNLAATLAGLSLTALALIAGFASSQETKYNNLHLYGKVVDPESLRIEGIKLNELKSALSSLKYSTFCFVGLLIETFTLEPWAEVAELINFRIYAEPIASGSLMTAGLFFMSRSILKISSSV